jgi:hypothetical protein
MQATQAGFLNFIRNYMGINSTILPDDSIYIGGSYNFSGMTVNSLLAAVPNPDPVNYTDFLGLAIYNYGGHVLVSTAQDLPNAPTIPGTNPALPYFANLRKKFNLEGFTAGIVTSASDNGTSTGLAVPDWYKDLSFQDLELIKTPWGRAYLAMAQAYGPNVWGLT